MPKLFSDCVRGWRLGTSSLVISLAVIHPKPLNRPWPVVAPYLHPHPYPDKSEILVMMAFIDRKAVKFPAERKGPCTFQLSWPHWACETRHFARQSYRSTFVPTSSRPRRNGWCGSSSSFELPFGSGSGHISIGRIQGKTLPTAPQ